MTVVRQAMMYGAEKKDLSKSDLSGEDVQDQAKWGHLIRHIDPT